ncbi:MAG: 3-dehydroquinate synthase [Deltaproteobacteria bacterium GWC2_42_51]|nr:MAG: 3-dehydroquinate synthase [Deltaproteobacteria bacterium GWB2_42_7]OGP33520.1 MAG: 3-dehydroquinate synthase [Deltaproteobacteria bacterium GWC2_42_51]OGP38672.1 MAG: 3-dehydroquinate synthase [Deltaproteobacteria bacterium GWD2_42_10]OGQ25557.1 MAG: 3-dehydroquinate synthase [Deltaproteobacteria bacterium RIFCSPHIGHO2_02_FULL_42_44]OGQ37324.1 MAG: 3-dehydroquinate synthase [Deltaproteobacteria bacterium RIFCSPLOWO2_02_FULL_42_39]OGQ68834.1 MAG: 3-dehydroquinate synthase [Deltaproteoba
MEQIIVNLGERSYPILIGRGNLNLIGEVIKDRGLKGQVACITNPTVGGLYGDKVISSLRNAGFDAYKIDIPDGEEYKSLEWASNIYDKLIEHKMERQNPIIALGGGVIGDIAGFVAATYLRGVPFIQAPTTLLAQVDSSVGGKTAVNHKKGKNLIGAFYQPELVLIDIEALKTLEERDLRAGLAEVVKYGIIRDAQFFSYLENNYKDILNLGDGLIHAINTSCRLKAEVVEEDERETGIRAILNFGHTFGHAIEAVTNYKELKHGEAVAIGMAAAARLSFRLGLCKKDVYERIEGLLVKIGLPVRISDVSFVQSRKFSGRDFFRALELDKKMIGGKIKFILTKDIGRVALQQLDEREFSLDLNGILN